MMEVISVAIEFDALTVHGDFMAEEIAYEWVATTLRRLLQEYGISQASRIAVRRR
jgi:hypothetical protein